MTNDKGIFIKNIYYMLSYAFQVLQQTTYESVAAEEFEDVQDLFAAILAKGVARQLKQGLYREYVPQHETLSVMRGKLDMPETIRQRIQHQQKLGCEFDELTEDNLFNQILKTTMYYLVKDDGVKPAQKIALNKVLLFFDGIGMREPSEIDWNRLQYQRNNKNYEMLINICYLVMEGLLQTTEAGGYRMMGFSDAYMETLYEKFILEYYRKHHSYLTDIRAKQVKWDLVGDPDESMLKFLPAMQTDVYLRLDDKVLIIDAKYYKHTLQQHMDKYSLHSGNLYQIFTYVKNEDRNNTGNVAGLLLYAKTEEELVTDCMFNMGGNWIGARTLDLNKDFRLIASQLDQIANEYFCDEYLVRDKEG